MGNKLQDPYFVLLSVAYMNHSRYLILDGIHRNEGIRKEGSFPSFFSMLSTKHARETLVPFFTSLV